MAQTYYSQALQIINNAIPELTIESMDEEGSVKSVYLGNVFTLFPSGKYHTWFACSNVTAKEIDQDERFIVALDKAAAHYDGWIESGQGDPCDIYFCRYYYDE